MKKKNGKGPVQTDIKRPKGNRIGSGGAPVCFVTFTCGQLRQPQQSSNREMVTPHSSNSSSNIFINIYIFFFFLQFVSLLEVCINNGPNSEKYERKKKCLGGTRVSIIKGVRGFIFAALSYFLLRSSSCILPFGGNIPVYVVDPLVHDKSPWPRSFLFSSSFQFIFETFLLWALITMSKASLSTCSTSISWYSSSS